MKKKYMIEAIEELIDRVENIEHVLVQLVNYLNPGEEEWDNVLIVKKIYPI